jgi:hypothetical protein
MKNHYNDPISQDPNHIGGNSRKAGDAGLGAKTAVIFDIIDQAQQYGLSDRDVANLLAIAKKAYPLHSGNRKLLIPGPRVS